MDKKEEMDYGATQEDLRLDLLIETAQECDASLSLLASLSSGFSDRETAKLCGNVRSLPKYIKSKVKP